MISLSRSLGPRPTRGCLIQHQPVAPQLPHGFRELDKVDRLAHVAVDAPVVGGEAVPVFYRRGQNHDRDEPGRWVGAHLREHAQAVDLGQLEIEQHQLGHERLPLLRTTSEQLVQRLDPIARHDDAMRDLVLAQRAQRELLIIGVVFDQ
jgi:hypothetical protein